jgi:hypothetical protein
VKEVRDVLKQISELDEKMKIIEDAIGVQTDQRRSPQIQFGILPI